MGRLQEFGDFRRAKVVKAVGEQIPDDPELVLAGFHGSAAGIAHFRGPCRDDIAFMRRPTLR
jgi:hypothetical protein